MYPVRVQDYVPEDSHSVAEHSKALNEEMKKPNPRDSVLLPLMKHTFHDLRILFQNNASSVTEILDIYPALARPAVMTLTIILYCLCFGTTLISLQVNEKFLRI